MSQRVGDLAIRGVREWLADRLSPLSDTASLDAQVLLRHITGQTRSWLLAHPEAQISPQQQKKLARALSRLEAGTPLPYILGHWEFYCLDFIIAPSVMIPRPETELLVEKAIDWLHAHPHQRTAADIGTGSGCIAVTLAKHVSDLRITATDISAKSLKIARSNAEKHNVIGCFEFVQTDLLPPLPDLRPTFDIILANLPYIPTAALQTLKVYGREPTLALDGGHDGLNLIRSLLRRAPRYLAPGGLLLLEIDASHGVAALTLAQEAFPSADVRILPDLAGHDRLIRVETQL
ncbi:MAG: peptide chain release factor N(5)-glutamine methyltransferase [Chloroflexota bacterium]|nr:peptide chain release factor N(5)-glutamine methyltransferase [Chloroflexota bacterium]